MKDQERPSISTHSEI